MSSGPTAAEVTAERATRTSQLILDAAGIPADVLALHLAMKDRDRLRTLDILHSIERAQMARD